MVQPNTHWEEISTLLNIPLESIAQVYGEPDENLRKGLFYLFTGRGLTREGIHLGHYINYTLLAKLSRKNLVFFQISQDQKRAKGRFIPLIDLDILKERFVNDVSKFDWNFENTVFFDNLGADKALLDNLAQYISSFVKTKTLRNVFGEKSPYFYYYFLIQCGPILALKSLDLTPVILTAQDEKGYFQILRDLAPKLKVRKPLLVILKETKDIYLKDKMSSSIPKLSVYLDETMDKKIRSCVSSELDPTQDFCMVFLKRYSTLDPSFDLTPYVELWNAKRSLSLKEKTIKFLESFRMKEPRTLPNYGLTAYLKRWGYTNLKDFEQTYL